MSACFDTSALFKLAVPEPGAEVVGRVWDATDEPDLPIIGDVELQAVFSRAVRNHLDVAPGSMSITDLWGQVTPVDADAALVCRAGSLAVRHALGTLDAIHLASALVAAQVDAEMVFVTFDARLRSAAAAEGFQVLPVVA